MNIIKNKKIIVDIVSNNYIFKFFILIIIDYHK